MKRQFDCYKQVTKYTKLNIKIQVQLSTIISRNMLDESSSDQSSENNLRVLSKVNKIPKIAPLKKMNTKSKKHIYINLSMTQYDVIGDIAEELGWGIQSSSQRGDWDVFWTDSSVDTQVLIKMHYFQKISHFPGIHVLARKNLLGQSLMQMRQKFKEQYNFFPLTWMLPSQYHELRMVFDPKSVYIVKPEAQCQGKGIFLTNDLKQVQNGNHYVVQQYISKPYLIQGLKFDFRIYVLLCGTNPLRLYVYQEGLARFATEKYAQPNQKNMKKQFVHLTNYAINKKNPKYIYNKGTNNMGVGHKRSLTSVLKTMQRRGENITKIRQQINDIILKTLIVGLPLVSHQYKFCQPDDQNRNMCFHILGIDIMLDQNCKPYVLEVNHTPSFTTDTPLDYNIKSCLIKDTLILMNINIDSKAKLIKKTKQKLNVKRQLFENQEQKLKVKIAQQKRNQYQNNHLGAYKRIYPLDNPLQMEKYQKLMTGAENIYFSQNNVLRAQMESQKNEVENNKNNSPKKSKLKGIVKSVSREKQTNFTGQQIVMKMKKREACSTVKTFNPCKIQFLKAATQVTKPPSSNYIKIHLIKNLPRLQPQPFSKNRSTKNQNKGLDKFNNLFKEKHGQLTQRGQTSIKELNSKPIGLFRSERMYQSTKSQVLN